MSLQDCCFHIMKRPVILGISFQLLLDQKYVTRKIMSAALSDPLLLLEESGNDSVREGLGHIAPKQQQFQELLHQFIALNCCWTA